MPEPPEHRHDLIYEGSNNGSRTVKVYHRVFDGITGHHDTYTVHLYRDGVEIYYWTKRTQKKAIHQAEAALKWGIVG